MSSRIRLDLPVKFPRWATDAGRTLEPAESGAAQSNKDKGWLIDDRPPAREMNWLQNMAYEWIRQLAGGIVSNWELCEVPSIGVNVYSVLWDDVRRCFVFVLLAGSKRSDNGRTVPLGVIAWGGAKTPILGIDSAFNSTHMLVGCTDGRLNYSVDGAAWAENDTTPPGGADISAIDTKYPTSDLIIIGAGTVMRRVVAGIGGVWANPAVPPVMVGIIKSIVHVTGARWYCFGARGEVSKSVDDGVNWATLVNTPNAIFSAAKPLTHGDINPTTGTIVAVGYNATNIAQIAYSLDDGATAWQAATKELPSFQTTSELYKVRYVGGNTWITVGKCTGSLVGLHPANILVSIDDGITWAPASCSDPVWDMITVGIAVGPRNAVIIGGVLALSSQAIPGL